MLRRDFTVEGLGALAAAGVVGYMSYVLGHAVGRYAVAALLAVLGGILLVRSRAARWPALAAVPIILAERRTAREAGLAALRTAPAAVGRQLLRQVQRERRQLAALQRWLQEQAATQAGAQSVLVLVTQELQALERAEQQCRQRGHLAA